MLNIRKELDTILSETNGELVYSEQVIEIGTKILGLSLEESDKMRKSYGKRNLGEMHHYQTLIFEKLEYNEETFELVKILFEKTPYIRSKVFLDTREKMLNAAIDSVLTDTNGEVRYMYQASLILSDVAGLNFDVTNRIMDSFTEEDEEKIELYRMSIEDSLKFNPEVANRIYQLLKNANIHNIPLSTVSFQ